MSYQVTARKWRPQTFNEVVEQEHVTRTLRNAIQLNRVAHAYLFAGTRGVGKTTMARVLAKALNCDLGPTPDPCDVCAACLEITQGASLDIIEIDGASNRGIDEIRDLRETLRYLPSRGRYKVYIIDEVHMLTKEAFNALLKTLEEPPPHVVFIFATTEFDKIPYTIVSRCQRFEFKRVSLTGIVSHLEHIVVSEGLTISHASLLRIAKAAEGSMRDAQSLLDQVVAYSGTTVDDDEVGHLLGSVGSEALARCLIALFQQDAQTALLTADELQAEGHEASGILRALQEGLRHLIVLKTADVPGDLIPLSEADLDVLRPVADLASIEEIYGHFQVLSSAEQSMRGISNPFMVLEMALVRLARIGRVQSLETILESLQKMEQGQPASLAPAGLVPVSLPSPAFATASAPPKALPLPPAPVKKPASIVQNETVAKPTTEPATPAVVPEPQAALVVESVTTPVVAVPPEPEPLLATPVDDKPPPADFLAALQEHLVQQRPSVASLLLPGRILSHNETKIVIGFGRADEFCRSNLKERENLESVRHAIETLTGSSLQVDIVSLDDFRSESESDGGGQTDPDDDAESDREVLQKQKRETIQAVLDIFDGTIIT